MKYDEDIVEETNEAHNIILNQIVPRSKILEFGAASGRMTKWLKEKLKCSVYIVEYERDAYHKALQYAEDGMCTDIENMEWKKKWKKEKFDYIIFADVLEHLREPLKVLSSTEEVLKEDGTVLISVPNIAHNDILLKLYYNYFDYTEIGILDNTHLHFWAEENLSEFETDTGYKISNINYKTVPTITTEQFKNVRVPLTQELQILLAERINGEVYQFILTLKKRTYAIEHNCECCKEEKKRGHIQGRLYYDRGNGFNQGDSITVVAHMNCEDHYLCILDEILGDNIVRIRYDPLEGQPCIINSLKVCLNDKEQFISLIGEDIIRNEDKILLNTCDPQIIINNVCGKKIFIKIDFSLSKNALCQFISKMVKK